MLDIRFTMPWLLALALCTPLLADEPGEIAASPDGLVVAVEDSQTRDFVRSEPIIELIDTKSGERLARLESGVVPASRRVGKLLRTYGYIVRNYDVPCGAPNIVNTIDRATFAPDSRRLATACQRRLRIWSVPDGKRIGSARTGIDRVSALQFSRDGRLLAAGGGNRVVVVDGRRGTSVAYLPVDLSDVLALEFSPDARTLEVSGSQGRELWDVERVVKLSAR